MYPTNDELEKIKKWDFGLFEEENIREFVEYIQELWHYPNYAVFSGKTLILHTIGWSGNEDIIRVLQETLFWKLFLEKSVRGGHYYFKLIKKEKTRCMKTKT